MAEWLERRFSNPQVLGSNLVLPLADVVLGSPEFNFSATLVNN